jgi:hypothetical protein
VRGFGFPLGSHEVLVFWNVMLSDWIRVPLNFEGKLFLHHQEGFCWTSSTLETEGFYLQSTGLESPRDHKAIMNEVLCEIPQSLQANTSILPLFVYQKCFLQIP